MKKTATRCLFLSLFVFLALAMATISIVATTEGEEPSAEIAYCNLAFESNTYIQYAVATENVESKSDVTLMIWTEEDYLAGKEATKTLLYGGTAVIDGVEHIVFEYTELADKQMGDNVYAQVAIKGTPQVGGRHKYSILQYAYNKLGKTGTATENEDLKTLLKKKLEAGAAAQVYFDYKTNRLVTDAFYEIKVEHGKLSDRTTHGLFLEGEQIVLSAPESKEGNVHFLDWTSTDLEFLYENAEFAVTVGTKNEVYTAIYDYGEILRFTSNNDGTCNLSESLNGVIEIVSEIDIPPLSPNGDKVIRIGENVFAGQNELKRITIPETVEYVYPSAFIGCTQLIQTENGISYVDRWAISAESDISRATFREDTIGIAAGLFLGNTNLTQVELPKRLTVISGSLFSGCENLKEITIPHTVTRIGFASFRNCYNLENVVFEKDSKLTWIGSKAFVDCNKLMCFTVPAEVTVIGDYAFEGCYRLLDVNNFSEIPIVVGESTHGGIALYAVNVYNSSESIENKLQTTADGYVFYVDDERVYLVGYAGEKSILTLPETYQDRSVTVPPYAFYDCDVLTDVTIPANIKSIGAGAFSNCDNLKRVVFEEGSQLTTIEDDMFVGCVSLTEVILPQNLTNIGGWAFADCESLANISIPQGVTTIGEYAFSNNSSLINITVPIMVTEIGENAFFCCFKLIEIYNCSELVIIAGESANGGIAKYALNVYTPMGGTSILNDNTIENEYIFYIKDDEVYLLGYIGTETSLILPEDYQGRVYSIGDYAFFNSKKITEVIIPANVTEIGYRAFTSCSKLEIVIFANEIQLNNIGEMAFAGCDSLQTIEIPASVEKIEMDAFLGSGLKSVVFAKESRLNTIDSHAFEACESLQTIEIPASVEKIGERVFANCSSLKNVVFEGGSQLHTIYEGAFYGCNKLTTITIPFVGQLGDATLGYIFGTENSRIPATLKTVNVMGGVTIGEDAFSYCYNLENIYFSSTVVNINTRAFIETDSLISIQVAEENVNYVMKNGCLIELATGTVIWGNRDGSIPADGSVTNIGEYAFWNNDSLIQITIPSNIITVEANAFGNCSNLESVIFEENSSLQSIGNDAFNYCEKLIHIVIPENVTTIGDNAFLSCISLENGVFAENSKLRTLGAGAFEGCEKLKNISIPVGVTIIEDYTFLGCSELESIVFAENSILNCIGNDAFHRCMNLKSITIPNTVVSIGDYAFHACKSLKTIIIPASVKNIGNYAFSSYIFYHSGSLGYEQIVEDYCGLEEVIFEENSQLEFIGEYAFESCIYLKSIFIPENVNSIGVGAFKGCVSLTSIEVEEGNTVYAVIDDCLINLETGLLILGSKNGTIPSDGTVTAIGDYAFACNQILTDITIPSSVLCIGEYAFSDCLNLRNVFFLEDSQLASIENFVFDDCYNLICFTIPAGVTNIGEYAFAGCEKLVEIYNCSDIPEDPDTRYSFWNVYTPTEGKSNLHTTEEGYIFYIDDQKVYLMAYIGAEMELILPTNYENRSYEIYNYAFYNRNDIKSITIPAGITAIGGSSFEKCNNLGRVIFIKESCLSHIGYDAFKNCIALESIVIPRSVKSIYGCAFLGCNNLTIYAERSESDRNEWEPLWNPDNRPVIWEYQE